MTGSLSIYVIYVFMFIYEIYPTAIDTLVTRLSLPSIFHVIYHYQQFIPPFFLGPRGPHGIPLLVRPQEKFGSLIYRLHESSWIPPLTPWDPLIPPINPHDP